MSLSPDKHVNVSGHYEFPLTEWQKLQLSKTKSEYGVDCLRNIWSNLGYKELLKVSYCDGVWDNVYCWPPTKSGTVRARQCSDILKNVHPGYIGPLERCLRRDRVTVQIQLILSLLFRCGLIFVIAEPFVLGLWGSYRDVDILCEAVLVLFLYTTFVSVTWMFIQGLYLNVTLMTGAANMDNKRNLKIYCVIGWAVPAGFIFVYIIAMIVKKQERCWQGYSKIKEMWILLEPMYVELMANGLFLCNILRILLKKLRNSNSRPDASQIPRYVCIPKRAAAKATAILFPVLGINNLVLLFNSGGGYYKYYVMLNTFFGSTQGIFVAIVYCFANKEVLAAIQRSLQRAKARRIEICNHTQSNDQHQPVTMCMVELNTTRPSAL